MKKLISVAMALMVALMLMCTACMAEAVDVGGVWYGNMFGIGMTLTLAEDGSYTMQMDMEGEDPTTGTWEFDGSTLIMDKGTDIEVSLVYDAEQVNFSADIDGMNMMFTREMPQTFVASPVRADAALEEFEGDWTCTLIDMMGMQAPPDMMGINMSVSIESSTVELLIPELMGEEAKTVEGVFAEGTLTATIPAESEFMEDDVYVFRLLEDGTLSASTTFMEDAMTFYAAKVEVPEVIE